MIYKEKGGGEGGGGGAKRYKSFLASRPTHAVVGLIPWIGVD